MPNWKKLIVSGSSAELTTLKLTGLSGQSSEKTSLMINGSNVIGTRELGDNAFNSTSFATGDNFDEDGTFASLRAQGTTKGDVGLGNVENTALSTYTGNGGALDNQYIANGANYVTAGVTLTTAAQPNITSLGTLTSLSAGRVTVDDIDINGSTIADTGDLTLDVGGDLIIDVDGTDVLLKDGGTSFGRFKRDSSDFIIKSETQDKDIVFRGNDGGSTIDALTLDMSDAGAALFNGIVSASGATLNLANQSSEATAVMINGSNVLGKRELGSNAFNSTAFTTNTGTVTSVTINTAAGLDGSGTITTSGTVNLSLDLSELTDMTATVVPTTDEIILLDNGAERRKRFSEIFGSAAYSNTDDFVPGNDDGPIVLDATDGVLTSDTNLKWESPVLYVGSTSLGSSELRVQSSDTTQATISAYGSSQGTGRLYVGQSSTYGGGVLYNGDDNPDITSTTDKISYYRRNNGTDAEVFYYGYDSNTVNFKGDVVAFASSDERLKTNIKPIENTLDKIDRIGGYNFDCVPK